MVQSLTNLFAIDYPIIQGGMAHLSKAALVAAVSQAGALGVLSSASMKAEDLRREIRKVRSLTDRPFLVNLMLQDAHIPELVGVIAEEKPAGVTTGAGTPKYFAKELQKLGIKILPVIGSVYHAEKMAALGVDGLICEGMEAGGHIGQSTTLSLLPQVVRAVDLPVIAAGGIASGPAMAAVFCLGAVGVQCGTLFLAAEETPIGPAYRRKILEADDQATIVTGSSKQAPVRSLRNKFLEELLKRECEGLSSEEFAQLTQGSYTRAIEDDMDRGTALAGQVVGQIEEILPARELVKNLWHEYIDCQQNGVQ